MHTGNVIKKQIKHYNDNRDKKKWNQQKRTIQYVCMQTNLTLSNKLF